MEVKLGSRIFCLYRGQSCTQLLPGGLPLALLCYGARGKTCAMAGWQCAQLHMLHTGARGGDLLRFGSSTF